MSDLKAKLRLKSHDELIELASQWYETVQSLQQMAVRQEGIIKQQGEVIKMQDEKIAKMEKEIFSLKEAKREGGEPPSSSSPPERKVPDWVKPNVRKRKPDQPQKKRKAREKNQTYRRQQANNFKEYRYSCCPDCQMPVQPGTEYSRRQVIEIVLSPIEITDHIVYQQYCGRCCKKIVFPVDFTQITGGSGHYGVNLISLIAWLRIVGRVPIATIQKFLKNLFQVIVSEGEIAELLHRVAKTGKPLYDQLHSEIVSARYAHGDETGWREDGLNGYIWSFSTSETRYFHYSHSRGHEVPEKILTPLFRGILVSDFYVSYNFYLGEHQRCWVHFWRDVKDLLKQHPNNAWIAAWSKEIHDIYREAKDFRSPHHKERVSARLRFEKRMLDFAIPHARSQLPVSTLSKRLVQYEKELFTFVEYPEVPSENNPAERSVRPCVIARKISGGTRSANGSKTMMTLMSIFHTWELRKENGFQNCKSLLTQKPAGL